MVHNGVLTSVEESKLDIDGFNMQLSSAFFHHLVLVSIFYLYFDMISMSQRHS